MFTVSLGTIVSLIISYVSIYCMVYFSFIYFRKGKDSVDSLFHPGVSILIPAHNEQANIRACIDSIKFQNYGGSIEIIVLDDASTDSTARIVKSIKGVKYVKVSKSRPQGKTLIINQGVKLARHDFIGILDADSFLDCNAIKCMIGEFENPLTGAVVPLTKVFRPKSLIERFQMIEYTMSMCVRRLASSTGSLFMTHGVGTLFRKKALFDVGLFNTNTLTEDLNIALKLVSKGYFIRSKFNAIGYTVVPSTVKHVIRQRLRWNGGLFENTYWFKDLLFNKKYGNMGLFIMPANLMWAVITVYIAVFLVRDLFRDLLLDLRNLIITDFDFAYFFSEKFSNVSLFKINELTILSLISLVMFLFFYLIMGKRLNLGFKDSIISLLVFPLYFSVFFLINAVSIILTPFYLIRRGGRPWLTDKTI